MNRQRLQVAVQSEHSAAEHIEEIDAQLRSRESALTEANSRAEEYRRKLFTASEQLKVILFANYDRSTILG